jgi:putative photosynthetic complex assembly protein
MTEPHDHHHEIRVPRGALIGVGVLIGLTLAAVAAVRVSGVDPTAQVPAPVAPVASRALRFADGSAGEVIVTDAERPDAEPVAVLVSGTDGFVRGVLRSFARTRRAAGIGPEEPFVLSEQANGRLVLEDPATGQRIELRAFGVTNVESFRKLLAGAESDS